MVKRLEELRDTPPINRTENEHNFKYFSSLTIRREKIPARFLAQKTRIRGTNVQHVFFVTNEICLALKNHVSSVNGICV